MNKDIYIVQCWILKYARDDSDWIKSCIPFLSNASVFTYCEKCLFLSINYVFAKQKSTGRTQKKMLFYFQISMCYRIKLPRYFKQSGYAVYCYISCRWISLTEFEMTVLHVFENYVVKTVSASVCGKMPSWWYRYEIVQNQERGLAIFLYRSTRQNWSWELTSFKILSVKNVINRGLFYWTSLFLALRMYFHVLCLLLIW